MTTTEPPDIRIHDDIDLFKEAVLYTLGYHFNLLFIFEGAHNRRARSTVSLILIFQTLGIYSNPSKGRISCSRSHNSHNLD
jgi:hypothetical protein